MVGVYNIDANARLFGEMDLMTEECTQKHCRPYLPEPLESPSLQQ
jgi:hypothetical protein